MTEQTKAEIADALREAAGKAEEYENLYRSIDKEARAISRCIAALDPLKPSDRPGYSVAWGDQQAQAGSLIRVLHYLAERYGVPLVKTEREIVPCDRLHVEDASEGQLVQAMRFLP